jgi:hypothetical protein
MFCYSLFFSLTFSLYISFFLSFPNNIFNVHVPSEQKRTFGSWFNRTNVWIVTIPDSIKNKLFEEMYVSSYIETSREKKTSRERIDWLRITYLTNDENKQLHIKNNNSSSSYWSKETHKTVVLICGSLIFVNNRVEILVSRSATK